ncbi:hypothetical protein [uncultured Polaribacter sp.]|uniref:hypothetical protein n=1 Tax=uncultured Polaribacter sp. TaxID=174711 RepID=UPI0030DDD6CD|tara:strand:+ start:1370 stop:2008 length:639 start_codon:yes stop_codon:yes gene_type:complete
MQKLVPLFLLITLISGCSSNYIVKDYNPRSTLERLPEPDTIYAIESEIVPTYSQKGTYNFMHINGFKSLGYQPSKIIKDKNLEFVNQLNFYATYSSFYSGQLMFENFGDWHKYFYVRKNDQLVLIWENVKLLPDSNEEFTVYAFGHECTTCKPDGKSIYTSFSVINTKGEDCLTNNNLELKNKLSNFFSDKIKKLTNSNIYYNKRITLYKNK